MNILKQTRLYWAASLFFLGVQVAPAQVASATILGTVTDTTGAVVPNITVTATQTATNFTRAAVTNNQGQFNIPLLPIGTYRVDVRATGFKAFQQTGIVLEVDRTARVDPILQLGQLTETVTVSADATLVNTTDAVLGRTVQNHDIINLPLVNRDVYSLLRLTPGVDNSASDNPLGTPTQTTVVNGSSAGAGSVNYFLDGGNNTNGLRNTGNPAPNPDAVQEFRVITNNYGAEFGRFAGGIIDVVTKSGTNAFHGSLFEFLRNDKLNSAPYNSTSKAPLHRNQFGGTLGGPVIKDRTFFFGSYSGLRQRQSNFSNSAIVGSSLERAGDFSQSKTIPKDPLTGKPFPGGMIPTSRLDPTAQNILKVVPSANRTGNFLEVNQPHPFDTDEYIFKVDHSIGSHQISGSYYRYSGSDNNPLGSVPWAGRVFQWTQHNLNVGDTWSISPTLLNQLRATYVRDFGGRVPFPQKSLADFGANFPVQGTPSLPQIGVSGYFTLTNAISGPLAGSNYYGLRDVMNWNHGKHSIKFGADVYLEKLVHDALLNNYGVFSFDGSKTGNALADFVLGLPRSMSQDAPVYKSDNIWYTGLFFEDDIRIHPRLTLNLGLRYDVQTPSTDPLDRRLTFIQGRQSQVVPTAPLGILFPGDPGIERGIISADKNNFAPRVGLAWDPMGDGKMSIRSGFGVFYGSISGNEWNLVADHQPFTSRASFPQVATLTDPYKNYGGSPYPLYYDPKNPHFGPAADISGISPDFRWPYTYQMNFTVERQLPGNMVVGAGYVGVLAHKLAYQRDTNYPIYGPGATSSNVNQRRPIEPGVLSSIQMLESSMSTAYHGLQTTFERRFSNHFQFKGYYTYSKALDGTNLQGSNINATAQDQSNLSLDRARTDSDHRHNFVTSLIWDTNYFHSSPLFMRLLLNGWTVSGIVTLRSGGPFSVTSGKDNNLDGANTDRPNVVGDAVLDPNRSRSAVSAMWFNPAAFVQNPIGTDGNAGRNILDGPGYKNVDVGLFRDFRIRESMALQFRAEFTNFFNMVNLNNPNTTLSSSAVGTIRTAAGMREVQLGMRLAF